jgi:hypothetical protein
MPVNEQDARRLCEQVLSSNTFRTAARPRGILEYLIAAYFVAEMKSQKDIAADCFTNYHAPDKLNAVRAAIKRLKQLLAEYFGGDGSTQPIWVELPDGPGFKLRFIENPRADSVRTFWSPYCANGARPLVLITEPLFFRDDQLTYMRNVYCNDPNDRSALVASVGKDESERLIVSYHYFSAGEVMALLMLVQEFHRRSTSSEFGTMRQYERLGLVDNYDVILIGPPRANPILRQLQEHEPLVVSDDGVVITDQLNEDEEWHYTDSSQRWTHESQEEIARLAYLHQQEYGGSELDNWLWAQAEHRRQQMATSHELEKYVVVTRKPNPRNVNRTITMLALNHGRAGEGVMHFLTREHQGLRDLVMNLKGGSNQLPDHFQILFRVTVSKENGEAEPERQIPIANRVVCS